MARIPYPDPATQSVELTDKLRRMGSLNVTRMMSHSEGAMQGFSRLGTFLLRKGKLDPILREIVILRIGQICGSDYEWHQHVSVARAVGMDEATLAAVAEEAFDRLTAEQQLGIQIAEEIAQNRGASAELMARARQAFSNEELVELVLTAGYYIMTAAFLLSFDIEIEDGPPLGTTLAAR